MYAVTGATGKLGQLVIAALLKRLPPGQIVAAVRNPGKASELAAKGVVIRKADYDQPETLAKALTGVERVLLISGNELGQRVAQHQAVIAAARAAGVRLLGYTSVLRADTSTLGVAEDHRRTEELLRGSGVPNVVLRNGWYTENYTGSIAHVLQSGTLIGASGEGRISAATRADYAEGAAAALTASNPSAARTFELAGDQSFTRAEFAAELSRSSGKAVSYRNLSEADYRAALVSAGLPAPIAEMLARSESAAVDGALFDDGHQLSRLIGRQTTPLAQAIRDALSARV